MLAAKLVDTNPIGGLRPSDTTYGTGFFSSLHSPRQGELMVKKVSGPLF